MGIYSVDPLFLTTVLIKNTIVQGVPMRLALSFLMLFGAAGASPISVYGVWHCSNDYCTWATARSVTEFDGKNHWLIDRGEGRPSVNLVVLSFVDPLNWTR